MGGARGGGKLVEIMQAISYSKRKQMFQYKVSRRLLIPGEFSILSLHLLLSITTPTVLNK